MPCNAENAPKLTSNSSSVNQNVGNSKAQARGHRGPEMPDSLGFGGLFRPGFVVTIAFVFLIAESESLDNFERRDHEFDSSRSEV